MRAEEPVLRRRLVASRETNMEATKLGEQLKVIGDPARLRILALLPVTDDCKGVYNVSELAEALGIPQPTVSHHLCVLRQMGLVKKKKMCRDVYYWIDAAAFREMVVAIQDVVRPRKR